MPIVLDLDQRNSSATPDRVAPVAALLNARFGTSLTRPFTRTAGDEMQAILGQAAAFNDLVAVVLDDGGWWAGVGIGTIEHLGASSPESSGTAFKAARDAIEAAKRERGMAGPAVRGEPAELAASLQAALAGIAFIRTRRTERQRDVVAAVRESTTQRAAAQRLGITPQGVSDALGAAGYAAEQQLRELVLRLAAYAIPPE
jgi:hypothetical protein